MSWKRNEPEQPRGYHHGNLKEALVRAALGLIGEKGPNGFTFAEAARMAGVSPAAPYRHYRDRDELLADVAARGFAAFEDALAELTWLLLAARVTSPVPAVTEAVPGTSACVRFVTRFSASAPAIPTLSLPAPDAASARMSCSARRKKLSVGGLDGSVEPLPTVPGVTASQDEPPSFHL